MGRDHFAREDARDLFVAIHRDVEQEAGLRHPGGLEHLFPDRVAPGNAPGALRVPDHLRPVIGDDALSPGDGRQHTLRPAGEACKEVRLNEAGENTHVCFDKVPVDADLVAE